jgi:hypothetical protein
MSQNKIVIHSRREYMFIENKKQFRFNPEGIVCKNVRIKHKIPSGLREITLYFPINIYSLRECTIN